MGFPVRCRIVVLHHTFTHLLTSRDGRGNLWVGVSILATAEFYGVFYSSFVSIHSWHNSECSCRDER